MKKFELQEEICHWYQIPVGFRMKDSQWIHMKDSQYKKYFWIQVKMELSCNNIVNLYTTYPINSDLKLWSPWIFLKEEAVAFSNFTHLMKF